VKGDTFVPEKPRVWLAKPGDTDWDLSLDGKRVVVVSPVESGEAPKQEHELAFLRFGQAHLFRGYDRRGAFRRWAISFASLRSPATPSRSTSLPSARAAHTGRVASPRALTRPATSPAWHGWSG
jgi:hypothetical protein